MKKYWLSKRDSSHTSQKGKTNLYQALFWQLRQMNRSTQLLKQRSFTKIRYPFQKKKKNISEILEMVKLIAKYVTKAYYWLNTEEWLLLSNINNFLNCTLKSHHMNLLFKTPVNLILSLKQLL